MTSSKRSELDKSLLGFSFVPDGEVRRYYYNIRPFPPKELFMYHRAHAFFRMAEK